MASRSTSAIRYTLSTGSSSRKASTSGTSRGPSRSRTGVPMPGCSATPPNCTMREEAILSELVMVIEDEKEIRDLVRYNLEKAGYRVTAAADGEQGLKQLFASRPDALVL